jgi:23S rRNA G2445 N2-methylase RlmL
MKSFYFGLGERFLGWPGWRLGFLVGNDAFESAFHHRPKSVAALANGPIDCHFYQYLVRGGQKG